MYEIKYLFTMRLDFTNEPMGYEGVWNGQITERGDSGLALRPPA